LTVFLELDLPPTEVARAFGAHCFYTPATEGLSSLGLDSWVTLMNGDFRREALEDWLSRYFALTTYEVSCPAIRDASLAPEGKTGLIVSTLFPVDLVRHIDRSGWYTEFKELCVRQILSQLEKALPGLGERAMDSLCSTPLTIERHTGNADGAITGWSFRGEIPAESRLQKIVKSVRTPFPHVHQAGQWTFSPSGLPVSVLTGKLAADAARKEMVRKKA
jgi:phytoene dehydrogenase-like protein